ncbi:MAG: carboxylating nicotinate-nucleotide diphosphorylase [Bacteroidota bacterium]
MSAPAILDSFQTWLAEDLGEGDHTTLATIGPSVQGKSVLIAGGAGVLAGVQVALDFFQFVDPSIRLEVFKQDGERIHPDDIVFRLSGPARSLLIGERVALNLLQRMSGIATLTDRYSKELKGTKAVLLDTRKTTPGIRWAEKQAVIIGGGQNHRFGLFDRVLIKDNHIDHGGGVVAVLEAAQMYLREHRLNLPVEIEVRGLNELNEVLGYGKSFVNRVMLDNFSVEQVRAAVVQIDGRLETEVSGGIRLENIRSYAETGVDFISVGALTHQATSVDLRLKTVIE